MASVRRRLGFVSGCTAQLKNSGLTRNQEQEGSKHCFVTELEFLSTPPPLLTKKVVHYYKLLFGI
jgi:hypothetical protein